ncbi:MAG: trigger factor [Clostridia bacterium]|nr:trigger factor [Clostridia bacterium]
MKYETAPAEKSTVKVTMTFDAAEWAEANNQAYVKNRSKYAVNGFRKGKVPKHVLETFYGKGLFYEDALNLLYVQHYGEVLEKEKDHFTAVGDPSLAVDDITDEKVVLIATIPVKPEVKIEKYKGIKIKKVEYTVTDADVEKEIENTRDRLAEKIEVTDRAAKNGDTVTIDFVGKADGKEFEGGSAENYDLTLGSGTFIAGFEEQVVGMKLGETKDVNVTFPEDYQAENLKGKPAVFTVTLHKITGKKLPELNDEFAKKVGSDSVEAYREKIKARLETSAKSKSRNETENSILSEIAKGATAEIPDAMVEAQEDYSLRNMEYNLMYQGVKLDDYLSYIGSTREEYKKNFEEEARNTVLQQLVLEKIIELEKITATEKEIDAKIEEQAKSVGKSAEEYKKTLDPRQRNYIENDIKVTKAFDFLEKNNEMYLESGEKPAAKKPAAKKTTEAKPATEKKETAAKHMTTTAKKEAGDKPKTTAKKKEN